jgi:thymidylate synthase (FAD)
MNHSVVLEQVYGDEELIARMARMSFAKYNDPQINIEKLISHMRKCRNHWTPFSHAGATFLITAPIPIARQLWRHVVGLGETDLNNWSEQSGRYSKPHGDYYVPDSIRGESQEIWWTCAMDDAVGRYGRALELGYPKEQARMLLPQGMFTSWGWSGNVAAWLRVATMRLDPSAQKETQMIIADVVKELEKHFPNCFKDLKNE